MLSGDLQALSLRGWPENGTAAREGVCFSQTEDNHLKGPESLFAGGISMYAIIETGGKQYRVQEGDVLFIEKLDAEDGATVTFDKVLAVSSEGNVTFGKPLVDNASVTAKVLGQGKGQKDHRFQVQAQEGIQEEARPQTAFHQSTDRKRSAFENDQCSNKQGFNGSCQKHRDQRAFRLR